MLKLIRSSLGLKITILLGMILILVLSAITVLNFSAQKEILLNWGLKEAKDLGESILTGIRYPMIKGDQDIIQLHFDNFSTMSGIKSISLLDHKGIIKRSTEIDIIEKQASSALIEAALLGKESHGIEFWKNQNQKVFTEAIPIFNERQCVSCHGTKDEILGVLNISLDWQPVLMTIIDAKNLSIMIAIIGLIIISISVVFLILQTVIRPIFVIEQGMRRVSEGDLKYKLPDMRLDEIGRVSKMFNKMTSDISNFVDREKELRYAEQLKSKELAESISLISATLESTADGIFVVDTNRRITKYNKQFVDIWEVDESILKEGDEKMALHQADKLVLTPDEFFKKVECVYADPGTERHEIIKFKNGKIIELDSKPQKIGDKIVGVVWSCRDVTEKKRTEKALKNKMDELERFNNFVVGREIRMKELKEEIAELKEKIEQSKP